MRPGSAGRTRRGFAEQNYLYRAFVEPNDPSLNKQWALDQIQAYGAWDLSTGSEAVTVAVLDTGIDQARRAKHEDPARL